MVGLMAGGTGGVLRVAADDEPANLIRILGIVTGRLNHTSAVMAGAL
jgi:hypothetical protein